MKKIITAVLLLISFASFGQSGVDSTTINTSTPMAAKQYQFKYLKVDSGLSVRKRFFAKDSAFFSGRTYTSVLPASDDSSNQVPNTKWVKQEMATVGIGDTAGRWVYAIAKNSTGDSIIYYRGGIRYAVKDSIGIGSFARDTIVAGRGLTATTINAMKVQLDNDSAIYIVTQINDSTLSFTHYDGRIDTVSMAGSGGGGGSGWGLSGNAITTGDFLGTTNGQKLMFKVNNAQSGLIDYSGNNVSLGYQSFLNNTSGSSNNAIGSLSLQSNTSGAFNNAMGHFSLYTNTSGALNTAIGNGAMYFNTTGSSNNAVGYQSLYANTTGIENNGFGVNSIRNNTTGQMNTAMGDSSLVTLTTGSRNTAIGANADVATSSTDSSVAIGYEASAATKQLAFSPHVTTMFLDLDSASGTAPSIAGIDANGNWRKYATPSGSGGSPAGNYGNIQINRNGVFETPGGDSLSFDTNGFHAIGGLIADDGSGGESSLSNRIISTNDNFFGDITNGVYLQASGNTADNTLRLYSTGGNPMELHDDVTVIGNITAHNIIGATATQTDANFSAVAGTAYVLSGNNSATRTITMPTLAEGDVFEFYNENTSANKWVSSATIYLSDNTTFTTLADDTNYILRYVGGKLRVSN